VPVDTRKGDQFKPEFLAVNPNGKVPAIDDNGVYVFDSNAILLYLAEKTGKFLPPNTPKSRAQLAVLADVHSHRPRALFGSGRAFQALRAEGAGICA
jgi:glutathione S-transferase